MLNYELNSRGKITLIVFLINRSDYKFFFYILKIHDSILLRISHEIIEH